MVEYDYDGTLKHVRNTTSNRLFLAILFSFLTVVSSGSAALGDLLYAPKRLPAVKKAINSSIVHAGDQAWIDSYFVSRTYEELEGDEYDARANAFVLNAKYHLSKRKWPSIPTVILSKCSYESNLARPLPKVAVHAILRSLSKIDEDYDGSHLAVMWLQESEWPLFSTENLENLKSLKWKELAIDFNY